MSRKQLLPTINWRDPILAIVLIAFVYRLMGVAWGLPGEFRTVSLHPDEQVNLLIAQQIVPGRLDFTPSFYNYGTLYFTLLKFLTDIVGVYTGGFDQNGQLTAAGMGSIHLAGRVMNCLFGAITCGLVFAGARRFLSTFGAAIAASICVVAPGLVVHSRFQTVDALATMLAVGCLYWCLRGLSEDQPLRKVAICVGVFAGLSAGTKYVGFVALIAFLPVVWARGRAFGQFGIAVGVAILAFIVSTPGVLLEREAFVRDFLFELNHSREGHGLVFAQTSPAPIYHLGNLWLGMGLIATILGLFGLVRGVGMRSVPIVVVCVYFVFMYAAVSGGQIKFMRYVLPTIPALAIGVGYFVDLVQRKSELGKKIGLLVGFAVVGGLDRGGFVGSATMTAQMLMPDPRDVAGAFLRKQGDVRIGLASDPWFWTAAFQPETPMTRMMGQKRLLEMWSSWKNPSVALAEDLGDRFDWDTRVITDRKPEFISFSSLEYAAVERLSHPGGGAASADLTVRRYQEFVRELGKSYELVPGAWDDGPGHRVLVEDMEYIQPRVTIWKRKAL